MGLCNNSSIVNEGNNMSTSTRIMELELMIADAKLRDVPDGELQELIRELQQLENDFNKGN